MSSYWLLGLMLLAILQLTVTLPPAKASLTDTVDDFENTISNYEFLSLEEISSKNVWLKMNTSGIASFTPDQLDYFNEVNFHGHIDPEAYMSVDEIIRYHGYPVKNYNVTTVDGYILTIQRIPYGIGRPTNKPGKPVLLQHGLLGSAAVWVVNTKDKNLPYILADAGFDVWLGNIRGTLFGRNNTYLDPKRPKFWHFSFDEMAKYDLPAVINLILSTTGYQQIHYIGHSMGTTMAFALLASQPQYNKIVRTVFALAPVATLNHGRNIMRFLAPFSREEKFIHDLFGTGEFLPNSKIIKFFSSTVCNSPLKVLCSSFLFLLFGFDFAQLNQTRLPVYLHHSPAATSVQNVVHYAQLVESRKFQYYDFGEKKNRFVYGQVTPPEYNVSRMTAPVEIFWSDNDLLADPQDVKELAHKLPNLVYDYHVPLTKFSHLDFLWAIDVKKLLYEELVIRVQKAWQD